MSPNQQLREIPRQTAERELSALKRVFFLLTDARRCTAPRFAEAADCTVQVGLQTLQEVIYFRLPLRQRLMLLQLGSC